MRRPETTYERWQACQGRYEICRRQGCLRPAVLETLGLCEDHLAEYKAEHGGLLAERETKRAGHAHTRGAPARPR